MRVVLAFNPRSGSTRGPRLAKLFAHALEHAQIPFALCPVQEAHTLTLTTNDLHVCIGGDGTVLHALPRVIQSRCTLYHVPAGNENLFARHFGMTRDPRTLINALTNRATEVLALQDSSADGHRSAPKSSEHGFGGTVTIDLASAGIDCSPATPFAIMASLGPDASVVHRLEHARSPGGGHLAYTRPIIQELLAPHFPRLRLRVDGRTLIDAQRGWLVVANLPSYALNINPAHQASAHDGRLDVIFMPAQSRTEALVMAGLCLARAQRDTRGIELARARHVEIQTLDGPSPVQLDGDALRPVLQPGQTLTLQALPNALRVLTPMR